MKLRDDGEDMVRVESRQAQVSEKVEAGFEGRQVKGLEKMENGDKERQARGIETKQAELDE